MLSRHPFFIPGSVISEKTSGKLSVSFFCHSYGTYYRVNSLATLEVAYGTKEMIFPWRFSEKSVKNIEADNRGRGGRKEKKMPAVASFQPPFFYRSLNLAFSSFGPFRTLCPLSSQDEKR